MAPIPSNLTGRVFVDYTANARNHTVMFRYQGTGGGAPDAAFLTSVTNVMQAMNPRMPTDYNITGWRFAAINSNITNPIGAAVPTVTGTKPVAPAEAPAFWSFVGRSSDGRRTRIYFLGAGYSPADDKSYMSDYRVTPTEDTVVQDVLDALAAGAFVSASGFEPVFNPYANLGYHGYWQRKVRG